MGLPPPAHPELDDAAPRLAVHRPGPGGLHVGPRARRPPRAVRRLVRRAARARAARCWRSSQDRRRRLPGRHRRRGTWQAQNVVVATGPPDGRTVPAVARAWPATSRCSPRRAYRNPRPAARRRRAGGRRLGLRGADRRRAGPGRPRVVLAVGSHTRMPRRYRGMDMLLVAGADRPAGPHDRRRAPTPRPPAASRRSSWRARARTTTRRRPRPGRAAGRAASGWPAGCGRVHRHRVDFADDLRGHRRRGRRAPAPVPRPASTPTSTRTHLAGEVEPGVRPRPGARRADPASALDLRAEGIRTVVLATGFRAAPPVAERPRHRHRTAASASTAA